MLAKKPLLTRSDILPLLPGQGRSVFDKLLQAEWLAALPNGFYRADALDAALVRLAAGETPRPVWKWMAALSFDSNHLVCAGKPACGFAKASVWVETTHDRKCTRCQGAAKERSLRVE